MCLLLTVGYIVDQDICILIYLLSIFGSGVLQFLTFTQELSLFSILLKSILNAVKIPITF